MPLDHQAVRGVMFAVQLADGKADRAIGSSMAKLLYCWRCRVDVPMLEEHEVREIQPLLEKRDKSQAALALYNQLTGFGETNPAAIHHHKVELYGPPCEACGKPLRTPRAKFCAACGVQKAQA